MTIQVVEKPTDKDAPFKPFEGLLTLVVRDVDGKVLATAPATGNQVVRLEAVEFAPARPMAVLIGRQNAVSDYSAFAQVFAFEGGKLTPVVTYTAWLGSVRLAYDGHRSQIQVEERLNEYSPYLPDEMLSKPYPRPYRTTAYAWENGQFTAVSTEMTRKAYPLYGKEEAERPLPEVAVTRYKEGLSLIGQGKPADAIKPLQEAVTVAPDYTDAHNDLSYAWALLGRWAESQAAARKAVALNPWHAAAQYNLGVAHLELHQLPEAEHALLVATGLQEQRWEPHYRLGLVYEQQKRPKEALHEFDLALQLKPDATEVQEARRRLAR